VRVCVCEREGTRGYVSVCVSEHNGVCVCVCVCVCERERERERVIAQKERRGRFNDNAALNDVTHLLPLIAPCALNNNQHHNDKSHKSKFGYGILSQGPAITAFA
jgi:hypothetical protein